jgi:hypothetical protein
MLVAATLVPSTPLLLPGLGGAHAPLPELGAAADGAVAELLAAAPDVVAVVGPATDSRTWPPDTPVDVGPFLGRATTVGPPLPLSLAVGRTALRTAGYRGGQVLHAVAAGATPDACLALGRELAAADRVGLLVVGDGSACRSLTAPGWFDARAEAFDADVERAVRAGDLDALLDLDTGLAADLQAAGRPAWQVLAGAAGGTTWTSRIGYADAPLGVGYLVAALRPA